MKSKGIAYLLWFLGIFGILGLHRFYLGKIGTGILWIFTGGVFMIGSIIDLFTLGGQVDVINTKLEMKQIKNTTTVQQSQPSETSMSCRKCNKPISSDFAVCPYCSTPLRSVCPKCEKQLSPEFIVCPYCGSQL